MDDAALGIYRIGSEIARQIFSVRVCFASVYASLVARYSLEGKREAIAHSFVRVSAWVLYLAAPITAVVFLYQGDLLHLFDPAFAGEIGFMSFLLLGSLVACGVGLSGNILVMSGYPHFNLLNSALLTIINVILNIILIPDHGLAGAALATMVATVGVQLLQLLELRQLLGIRSRLAPLARPVLAALFGLLVALAARRAGVPEPAPGMALALLYAAMALPGVIRLAR